MVGALTGNESLSAFGTSFELVGSDGARNAGLAAGLQQNGYGVKGGLSIGFDEQSGLRQPAAAMAQPAAPAPSIAPQIKAAFS